MRARIFRKRFRSLTLRRKRGNRMCRGKHSRRGESTNAMLRVPVWLVASGTARALRRVALPS